MVQSHDNKLKTQPPTGPLPSPDFTCPERTASSFGNDWGAGGLGWTLWALHHLCSARSVAPTTWGETKPALAELALPTHRPARGLRASPPGPGAQDKGTCVQQAAPWDPVEALLGTGVRKQDCPKGEVLAGWPAAGREAGQGCPRRGDSNARGSWGLEGSHAEEVTGEVGHVGTTSAPLSRGDRG